MTGLSTVFDQVMLECAGMSQPIFVVTGSCQGIEISLDGDSVPFGAVVIGSCSSRKLIMHNTGDIGAAFSWNIDRFYPDFSITPVKGYISPTMEVSFEIVFHPTAINHDIRYEVSEVAAVYMHFLYKLLAHSPLWLQPHVLFL